MLDFIKYFDPMSAISRGTEEYRANEKAQSDRLLAKIQAEMQRQQILAKQQEMSHAAQRQPLDLAELRAITEGRSLANRESRGKLDAIDLVGGNQYRARNLLREESKADRQATADFVKNLPAYGAISKYLPDVQQPAFLSSAMNQGGLPTPRQNINPQEVPGIFETMSKEIQNTEGYGASQAAQAKYTHEMDKQRAQDEAAMARTKVTAAATMEAAKARSGMLSGVTLQNFIDLSAKGKWNSSIRFNIATTKEMEARQQGNKQEAAAWAQIANVAAAAMEVEARNNPSQQVPGTPFVTPPKGTSATGELDRLRAQPETPKAPVALPEKMPQEFIEPFKKQMKREPTQADWETYRNKKAY